MSEQLHTLADLLTAYEHEYLPLKSPRTQYQHRLLYRWLCRELGDVPLTELTPTRLRAWIDTLRPHYKPNSIRRYLTALSGPLTIAVRDYEWLPRQPLRTVVAPPQPPGRERCLDAHEQRQLLAACQRSVNRHLYLVVLLALSTGCRKNELLQRVWADVDLEAGVVRLPRTKNGARRAVPLVGRALAALRDAAQQRGASPWVFPQASGLRPVFIDAAWVKARTEAGLPDLHFHDLRHTAASYLAMSGASLRDIAEVLGHKTLQQTHKYTHLMEPHTRGVVERMVARFLEPL